MEASSVRFQATPNPNAGKFTVGRRLLEGGARTFATVEQARGVPVAEALLGLDGVESVFMVADFITLTKRPDVDWGTLAPAAEQAIRANL